METHKKLIYILFFLFLSNHLIAQSESTEFSFKDIGEVGNLYSSYYNYIEYDFPSDKINNLTFEADSVKVKTFFQIIKNKNYVVFVFESVWSNAILLTIKYKNKTIKTQKFNVLTGNFLNYSELFCISKNNKIPLKNFQKVSNIRSFELVLKFNEDFKKTTLERFFLEISFVIYMKYKGKTEYINVRGNSFHFGDYTFQSGDFVAIQSIEAKERVGRSCFPSTFVLCWCSQV